VADATSTTGPIYHHLFGPVPSRRLGRSLGVDLVPFKTCTYDCVYCQLPTTTDKTCRRRQYVSASSEWLGILPGRASRGPSSPADWPRAFGRYRAVVRRHGQERRKPRAYRGPEICSET